MPRFSKERWESGQGKEKKKFTKSLTTTPLANTSFESFGKYTTACCEDLDVTEKGALAADVVLGRHR